MNTIDMSSNSNKKTVHQFRQLEFTALTALDQNQVQVEFQGIFNGQAVVWHATVSCLNPVGGVKKNKQSFSISHDKGIHYKIDIELDVKIIDEATVFKTMLMIHNYKRINIGRHEFGSTHSTTQVS